MRVVGNFLSERKFWSLIPEKHFLCSQKKRGKKPYFPTKSSIFSVFFLLIGKFFLPLFLIAIQNLMNDYSSVYDWFSYPMKKIHRLKRNYFTLPDHCLMQCNTGQIIWHNHINIGPISFIYSCTANDIIYDIVCCWH